MDWFDRLGEGDGLDRGGELDAEVCGLFNDSSNAFASVVSYIRSDLVRNFWALAILPSEMHFLAIWMHRRASPLFICDMVESEYSVRVSCVLKS